MRHWVRRAVAVAVAASLVVPPGGVRAQPLPLQGGDPPARVGRLARISGTVSFHLAEADRWEAATLNLPVTTGFALWTEPGARADIGVGGDRLVADQSTEVEMTRLDDRVAGAALPQGAVYWRVGSLAAGDSAGVQTPRGQVSFMQAGRYEVIAGDTGKPTVVAVVEGRADITGPGLDVHLGPNQAATITGDGGATPFQASVGALNRDAFLTSMLAEEQPVRRPAVAPPAYVGQMTGGEALEQYGEWSSAPEYGAVWYPPSPAGYVPYRDGHWAFVQPWGWTWVDAAPWGFAPSHYGRWVEVDSRWGWIPGERSYAGRDYPVYAPAVVGFLAGGAIGALLGSRVGWVPLGPREAYYPPYRVSNSYIRNVNVFNVTNIVNLGPRRMGQQPPFANRAAATLVPREAMVGSRGLAGLAQPVPAGAPPGFAMGGRPPVAPSRETLGVTEAAARRMNLPPVAGGERPAAPGPVLRAGGGVVVPQVVGSGRPQAGVLPGDENRGSGVAVLGGAALGGAALGGVAAGALLRSGGRANGPAGPGGMPALREPGAPGGLRPNGGAPGPVIGARPAVDVPGGRGSEVRAGLPDVARPGGGRLEARPEARPVLPNIGGPGGGRPEVRPEGRPAPAPQVARPEFQAPRAVQPEPARVAPPPPQMVRPIMPQVRPPPEMHSPPPQMARPVMPQGRPPPEMHSPPQMARPVTPQGRPPPEMHSPPPVARPVVPQPGPPPQMRPPPPAARPAPAAQQQRVEPREHRRPNEPPR